MEEKQKLSFSSDALTRKKSAIVFLVLIAIAIVVLRSTYVNFMEIKNQMIQNLEDVAKQNAMILEDKIQARYKLLLSLSDELEDVSADTIQEKLDQFEIFLEDFQLKRFAICLPGGMAYSTDGEVTDLSYREFYQEGMKGKCSITGILYDALNEQHNPVNVMTIPVYDINENVSGVFGLTYDTQTLNQSLQIDCFEGNGYICILNQNGEIMAVHDGEGLELSHDFFEDVTANAQSNGKALEQLKSRMEAKEEGSGSLYVHEKVYYYMVPVDLMDGSVTWYILTMLPAEVLNQRITTIQENQYMTVLAVMLLILVGALVVIALIKAQHKEMLHFAYEDPVTKGANYAKFHMEMERMPEHNGWLIVMDIANFNNISVVAGDVYIDIMIKEIWKIISSQVKREELAARVKDDMFLLYLTEMQEKEVLERMEHISESISEKAKGFAVYGIQARYGIYHMSGKETLESAYSKGKLAREYAVVNLGGNHAFYSEYNRIKLQHEKQLEDYFPTALEKEEFEVWYQPKFSAGDCKIVGSEALVRWRKGNGEMISPGEFIPIFEHNGMIVKLDEYMFRAVCQQQKKWMEEGKKVYPVSVNISRASLYCIDVHKRYYHILQEYGVSPEYLQLEVTETVMEERKDIYELLNRFRKMGIKILMDDFGTGYSSLATLSLHCFDTLKLDKTLIDHIGNKDGETMLYHIIRMGQQIGLHITAEGVETQLQHEFLQNLKCDDIQGYYFSKPITKQAYEEMINQRAEK